MSRKVFQLIVYAFIAVFIAVIFWFFPKWTVDDAYISFRYADNLAQYGQLTFNVNENPVEGYTGILLPLLIAIALKMGVEPTLASHILGIFSFLLLLIIFVQTLKKLQIDFRLRMVSLVLFSTASFQFTHMFSGMETLLYTFLLYASALQMLILLQSQTLLIRKHLIHALTLLFLSLCRPEGALYTVLALSLIVTVTLFKHKSFRPMISYLVFLVVPGVIYFIWRWDYYGFLLPNTFYAKSNSQLSTSTLVSMFDFGIQYLIIPILMLAIAWIYALFLAKIKLGQYYKSRHENHTIYYFIGLLCLFSALVIVQYLRSSLTMNFSYRFFVPFYPFTLILIAWLLTGVVNALDESKPVKPVQIIILIVFAMLVLQTGLNINWILKKEIIFASEYKTKLAEMHIPAGKYLKQRMPKDEWLVVHIDAGAVPFYSQLKTIDFGNLNDEFLAHNKNASTQERVDYFYSKNPGALVMTSYRWNCVSHGPEAKSLLEDNRFRHYALVKKYQNSLKDKYYEFIFIRRDLLNSNEEISIDDEIEASIDNYRKINCV